ncbi:DUF2057 family protein [Neptunomonas japonica]|uniref:Uncharacterized protein n=1 Tax=Neptunomonas japonica JAMM 1380 TaxID=1441457 RepID=A0A7R6SVQ2_9GAMM|nr:DUF2057 family protein [Neptunomonas japonica]BBB28965.1 conserved hypothetical protein [Neptunomonas japonica JAMM 1380]
MKGFGVFSAILVFLFSSCSFADVYLKLDDDIKLLAINGKEFTDASWLDNKKDISFKDGINQVLVELSAEIKTSANETDLEVLGVYVIVFEADSERFRLIAPTIKNRKDLVEFKGNPKWVMLDSNGAVKNVRVDELTKEGFQLSRDYEHELREYNKLNFPSEDYFENNYQSPVKAPSLMGSTPSLKSSNLSAKMLKYWYLNSSPKVQAEFIEWTKK